MTPKEKAKELVNKMRYGNMPHNYTIDSAKRCALYCVDEILNINDNYCKTECCYYWNKVKQEI